MRRGLSSRPTSKATRKEKMNEVRPCRDEVCPMREFWQVMQVHNSVGNDIFENGCGR